MYLCRGGSAAKGMINMEHNDNREEYGSDIELKSPILEKLSNFWYYYKWHTFAILFVVVVVVVCALQMCSRVGTDAYIIYAGDATISRGSEDGDIPSYNKLLDIVAAHSEDNDGDGIVNVALTTLMFLSPEQIAETEKTQGFEVNYALLKEDREAFDYHVYLATSGEYYLCFLSPYVYDTYTARYSENTNGGSLFKNVAPYLDEDYEGYELYSESAVKLSSCALWKNSATLRSILPEDTLVVLRVKSAMSGALDSSGNDISYTGAEALMRSLLAD